MKMDALHLFSLPHLGNMARENYKQRRWCGGTSMVGELPLGPGILFRAGCLAWLQMGQCLGVEAVAWLSVGLGR